MLLKRSLLILCALSVTSCDRLSEVGKAPEFTPITGGYEHGAIVSNSFPEMVEQRPGVQRA